MPTSRSARTLLRLWPRGGRAAVQAEFALTQAQLAWWTGAAPETAERTLKGWRDRGIVETGHQCVRVGRLEELRRIAGPDSTSSLSGNATHRRVA